MRACIPHGAVNAHVHVHVHEGSCSQNVKQIIYNMRIQQVCSQNIQMPGGCSLYTFCHGRLQNRTRRRVNTQRCAVDHGRFLFFLFFSAVLLQFLRKM